MLPDASWKVMVLYSIGTQGCLCFELAENNVSYSQERVENRIK